jgi:peptidoglycan L-alanyl-D-glutamate endopeptidase CwlK
MAYVLSKRSLGNMEGLHPHLVRVIKLAIQRTKVDFMVIEGLRSEEQCHVNWGKGRTAKECRDVGVPERHAQPNQRKVTWTLKSKHRKQATGYSHAFDALPAPFDWQINDPKSTPEIDDSFALMADAILDAAKELGVKMRWGANWDGDTRIREKGETDNPHFELI